MQNLAIITEGCIMKATKRSFLNLYIMKNCCVFDDSPKREKKSQHRFLKRAGFTDCHHLKPCQRGGQSISSNLLEMDAYRHDAWHLFFNNMTLDEIIIILSRSRVKNTQSIIPSFYDKVEIDEYRNNAWFLLFGDKSVEKIIRLLTRVRRFKNYQSLRLLIHEVA